MIVIAAVLCLLIIFSAVIDKIAFGKRNDKNPLLKYFSYENFGLNCESICVKNLKGFIYSDTSVEDNGKLIIFCHGMGPGQIAYTTEIAYFSRCGFKVLSLDSTGCNFSSGKSMKGFYEGVKTAVAAIDYAKNRFTERKIFLVGHSWGAYSVLCASKERNVDGVVAISAPDSPPKTVTEQASHIISRPLAVIICPFLYLINIFKFGIKGNADAAKCAAKNGVPTLLVHGDSDKVVPAKRAVFYRADGKNITKLLVKGKRHNPYNTVEAENCLADIIAANMRVEKTTENQKEFFKNIDFTLATQEDEKVMLDIVKFIENI